VGSHRLLNGRAGHAAELLKIVANAKGSPPTSVGENGDRRRATQRAALRVDVSCDVRHRLRLMRGDIERENKLLGLDLPQTEGNYLRANGLHAVGCGIGSCISAVCHRSFLCLPRVGVWLLAAPTPPTRPIADFRRLLFPLWRHLGCVGLAWNAAGPKLLSC